MHASPVLIGKLLVSSVLAQDVPVVQFVFLLVAVRVTLGNYVVDLRYGVIDPRVAVEERASSRPGPPTPPVERVGI